MSIIAWIILGLFSGFIASKLVNRRGEGFFVDILLGVIGSVVGGLVFSALGSDGVTGVNLWSMFVSVSGAVIVLVMYHSLSGRRGVIS